MGQKIQWRRGTKANLPLLDVGEPALTTDTSEPFIGGTSGNIPLAKKTQEAWIAPVLQNAWVNYGDGNSTAGYCKDEFGNVRIKGYLKSGMTTAGTTLFVLPAGYRPAERRNFPSESAGTSIVSTPIYVDSNGTVALGDSGTGNAWLMLDGITFRAEQ
jgi:hypothetical protein